ncbi:MAG: outer membrane protein assembly factor BamA [Sphingomonadales bacterium]
MLRLIRNLVLAAASVVFVGISVLTLGGMTARPVAAQAAGPAITEIRVEGNQRIEADTIRSYMLVAPGDDYAPDYVDHSLKALFATGLFADVTIRRDDGIVTVTVVENPIINRVALEGNKQLKEDDLLEEAQLGPRVVYTRAKVRNDVQRMIELYRRSGRFAATVEPKVIRLPQNRVDLVYEINEGPKSGVRRINFIGNKDFSGGDLSDVIATKEKRWWRFLTSNDTYDPDRLAFDRELLRQHYLTRGYADFRVISAIAELTPDRRDFFITVTLEEGEIYDIGKVDVESQIRDLDPETLRPLIRNREGKRYNAEHIDQTIDALTAVAGLQGYAFLNVRPRITRDREAREMNITYRILEAPRVYVERINIRGNSRTLDRVIRREFRLVEGDAFNTAKLRRSQVRIRGLGFFEEVEVEERVGTKPDRTVIDVTVEERATGELSIGAGFSSVDNIVGELSVRERNLLGRGQDLRLALSVSSRRQTVDLGFTEPRFMGRNLAAGFDLFANRTDFQRQASFDQKSYGASLRTIFPVTELVAMSTRYTLRVDELTNVSIFASPFVQASEGTFTTSSLSYSLAYDSRNDRLKPTLGSLFVWSQDLAGLGGNIRYIRSRLNYEYYHPLPLAPLEKFIFNLRLQQGWIIGLGQDVRINDRFFLGNPTMRGFDIAGIGPRDAVTLDALGGNIMYTGTMAVLIPLGPAEEFGIRTSAFVDFGALGKVEESGTSVLATGDPRVSAGISLAWDSPFGPIRFDFAKAIVKEPFDETEFFQFNIGAQF